jgi:phosphoribosyl 1,2-cyclic phosphate phosphodiesterase
VSGILEFTVLGCGSSGGVPRADGDWGACDPAEPKNRRMRCSLLVRRRSPDGGPETTVVVDTAPDFRAQALMARVTRLDAVLFTHDHADQAHGIDDVRAFFLKQGARIPTYFDALSSPSLESRFSYIFNAEGGYPPIAEPRGLPPHGVDWRLDGPSGAIPVRTFDQDHGGVRSVGFRFGDLAYSADVVDLSDESFEALQGLDVWIVDALRFRPHPTHAHVQRSLEWIARAKPRRAILTNMHIDIDYNDLSAQLPAGVELAYDGMIIETPAP